MRGIIGFDNYRINCIIGIEPHEREKEQEIFVDLKVETDFSKSVISDNIHDTINYMVLAEICNETAKKGQYYLIEKYADAVIANIFDAFDVTWAWIRVKKSALLNNADCTFVELKCDNPHKINS